MKTISVRDLRARTAQIWRELGREKDMVVTSNGRPVGVLSWATEDTVQETLTALRRARAMLAVLGMQVKSAREGRDRLTPKEIDAEIAAVRRKRRS